MRVKRILPFIPMAFVLGVAVVAGIYIWKHHLKKEAAQRLAERTIVATVNGEDIYESELLAGLPADTFDMTVSNIRHDKLTRLVSVHLMSQLLKSQGINVATEEIEAQVQDLKKNPPRAACPCCRYGSLNEYLAANSMDMGELRASIRNQIGFKRYLVAQWERDFPAGEKRDAVVQEEKDRVGKQYLKASHIMFRSFQQSSFPDPADRQRARQKALAALDRLNKGEAFETVAKDSSEDVFTNYLGGELGCIPVDYFGSQFARVVSALAPGERTTSIVESSWGFHIARREAIADKDVADVVANEYSDKKSQETIDQLSKTAVVKVTGDASPAEKQGA